MTVERLDVYGCILTDNFVDSQSSSHKAYHVISMLSDVNLRREVVAESDVFVENCTLWTHDNIYTTLSPSMMWYDTLKMTNLYLID